MTISNYKKHLECKINHLSVSVLRELLRDYLSSIYADYQAEELEDAHTYMSDHSISSRDLALFVYREGCQKFYNLV